MDSNEKLGRQMCRKPLRIKMLRSIVNARCALCSIALRPVHISRRAAMLCSSGVSHQSIPALTAARPAVSQKKLEGAQTA